MYKKEHDIQLLQAYIPTRVSKKSILLAKAEICLKGKAPRINYVQTIVPARKQNYHHCLERQASVFRKGFTVQGLGVGRTLLAVVKNTPWTFTGSSSYGFTGCTRHTRIVAFSSSARDNLSRALKSPVGSGSPFKKYVAESCTIFFYNWEGSMLHWPASTQESTK